MFYPASKLPTITKGLLAAVMAGALASVVFPAWTIAHLGLIPVKVLQNGYIWQTITYLFLHGGLAHLIFNMFAIYMFCPSIENLWGERKFLIYFLICGVGAALLTIAISPLSLVPTIGASGAIYGVLFAYAEIFPDSIFYLGFLLPIRAKHFIVLLFFLEFFLSQSPSLVARFAHLGGLLTGLLYFKTPSLVNLIKWRRPKNYQREKKSSPLEEVDRILDKIKTRGINSLSAREKEILEKASETFKHSS